MTRRSIIVSVSLAIAAQGSAPLAAHAELGAQPRAPGRAPCFSVTTPAHGEPAITALSLNGVPIVVRSPAVVTRAPILLWHGFGPPNSERALMQALPLDDVLAEKIYVGLPLFGARSPPGGLADVARRQSTDYLLSLLGPVADGVAADLRTLDAELRRRGCTQPREAIDLFGYSAGGFAVLYALNDSKVGVGRLALLNAPVSAAAAVAVFEHATGRAYAWSDASRQFARRYEVARLASRHSQFSTTHPSVLLLQGIEDDAALRAGDEALAQQWRPAYHAAGRDSRLQLRPLPGVAHAWLSEEVEIGVGQAVTDWFKGPGATG